MAGHSHLPQNRKNFCRFVVGPMSDVVIRAEGLGKKYLIGHETESSRDNTFRDTLVNATRRMRRSASDLVRGRQLVVGDEVEEFWALKDVDFEIRRGDVVGIIGRNGAGKSTLLKILSRITEPTEGKVTIDGRVASLLEVGTGFHPELSGRENIFLNGSILGMTRKEIQAKFDEIVDFAGVEKFIDTPVKRYSSGMKVRLGFSVAAHLEPEILIVDEVLAVGDAEFQKKCLGKMHEVAGNGRTVLFVSHNLAAVSSLCSVGMLVERGQMLELTTTHDAIATYSKLWGAVISDADSPDALDSANTKAVARLLGCGLSGSHGISSGEVAIAKPVSIWMRYQVCDLAEHKMYPNFHFYREDGQLAFISSGKEVYSCGIGIFLAECFIPDNFLNSGTYSVQVALSSFSNGTEVHIHERSAIMLNVVEGAEGAATRSTGYVGPFPGAVRPLLRWTVTLEARPEL